MNFRISFYIFFIAGFYSQLATAQEVAIKADVTATAYISDDVLPFWLYANSTSKIDAATDLAGDAGLTASYAFKNNHIVEVGTRFQYNNGFDADIKRNELYIKYVTPSFSVTVGAKAEEELQYGLSTSNKNFQMSRNARPFPGVRIKTEKSIKLSEHWSFDAELAHYELNDTRIVDGANIHHKMLKVNYTVVKGHQFSFAIRHYAMWGGTSESRGEQPSKFNDLIRIFLAQGGGEDSNNGEQLNALGNHLGSYTFAYDFLTDVGAFSLYHNHPFEDGSGTAFKNFPDGIWGLYLAPDDVWAVKGILYEYVETSDQSGATGRSGRDNYFNNRTYRSGWTYDGITIGIPFITVPSNTRVTAHHLGVFMQFKQFNISSKVSYVENKGTYFAPLEPTQKGFYTMLNTTYNTPKFGSLTLLTGLDALSNVKNNFGVGLQYSYQIQ